MEVSQQSFLNCDSAVFYAGALLWCKLLNKVREFFTIRRAIGDLLIAGGRGEEIR